MRVGAMPRVASEGGAFEQGRVHHVELHHEKDVIVKEVKNNAALGRMGKSDLAS